MKAHKEEMDKYNELGEGSDVDDETWRLTIYDAIKDGRYEEIPVEQLGKDPSSWVVGVGGVCCNLLLKLDIRWNLPSCNLCEECVENPKYCNLYKRN